MQHTYIFLTKKVAVSGAKELSSVAWMKNRGFIAVGADEGVVKVLQLPGENEKSIKNPFKKFMHLEGHSSGARVIYASWNEVYQKLATCDEGGLIVVWIMHPNEEGWFEEMVNNRQKSSVVAVKWSHDGTRIGIAYEDGQIIIGTVDGNRIWSKDLTSHLAQLCWHGSDALVLVGLSDGDVHGYDMNGNFAFKVTMMCVETVELRTALEKDLKKDVIIFMDWFVPTPVCKADPLQPNEEMLRLIRHNAVPPEPIVFRGEIAPDQPRFVVAYQHGILQMMRSELDTSPIICRLPNTVIIQCAWSPDGSILAVAGYQTDLSDEEKNLVHFLTPFGVKIQTMKLTAGKLSGITWEGSGLRLVVTIDAFIYLAIVKPAYKWAFCGKTLVYTYKNIDVGQEMIMFYETKMDDTFKRQTADVWQLLACGDYCVVVSQVNEVGGIYKIEVCDSIGTPVDSTQTNVQPFSISVAPGIVVMASSDKFLVWYYHVPRTMTVDHRAPQKPAEPQVYHIDDYKSSRNQESGSAKKGNRTVFDGICCVCTGKDMILVGRESGTVHRYNLPDVTLVQKYQLSYSAETMALNSTNTRLALINKHHLLKFFDIKDNNAVVVPNFERKDVWGVIWDKNREDTLVCMEKQKVLVIHGTETEDPVNNTGYLCDFTDLMVKCAQLDEVLRDPESPTKSAIVSIETKTLRQAKELLDQDKIPEATKFIEGHSHPKLWNLLATFALNKLDLKTAEHAFVELQDFGGLQFLKKLKNIKSEALKKAEVCTFLGDLDVAEHICFENDRRDLAIDMRTKMNDWFRVLQILQTSTGPGDDIMLQRAWKHVGDFFMDRQKWQSAAKHYESGQHFKELVKCYVMMDDYARLETLAQQLPDGHEVLKDLADIFTNSGLCNQAVECYLRLDMINEALDTCIRLNQWDKAVELSEKYKLSNAINLLNNYAEELTGSIEKTLAAAQLYRKAAMSLEATKIIFNIAKDQMGRQCPPLRAKKLFVMGGLLIEQHREHSKSKITKNGQETSTAAIKGLLEEEHTLSIEDSRLIDTAWRGAEAMHFYMLCQQQLHQHKFDAAMKTALVLTEYEEVIPSLEIYTLLALASCQAKQFSVCSKAFMKIESMDNIPEDELEQYNALSLKIFLKYPPKDTKPTRTECHTCGTMVMDYATSCTNPTCGVKFPICIASGRPIHDYQFWLCPQCKHRAYEQEIQFSRHCPLCHCAV